MGLYEMPDAARLAKQLVTAHAHAGQDMAFTTLVYDDALAELAADSGEIVTQTFIELARLADLAVHLAAEACESTPEITRACLLRHYDQWQEQVAARGVNVHPTSRGASHAEEE